jgi:ABC-type Fe3+/spermidine/putrescine transport system ATPase subunit
VALARALSARPAVLLLDEPLSALDDETREQTGELLKEVQRRQGVTALHVTHSLREAEQLADVLLRMEAGQVTVAR